MGSVLKNTDFRSLLSQAGASSSSEQDAKPKSQQCISSKEKHKQRYLQILRRQKQREAQLTREAKTAASTTRFRDRAAERRNQSGEYAEIAKEFQSLKDRSLEESKFLGGDIEHTHLVKGLDFVLLSKVRSEIEKKEPSVDAIPQETVVSGPSVARRSQSDDHFVRNPAAALLSKRLVGVLTHGLHPHHVAFKKKLERVESVVYRGSHFRGNTTNFYPGRMLYQFTLEASSLSSSKTVDNDTPPVAIFQALNSTTSQPPAGVIAPPPSHVFAMLTGLTSEGGDSIRRRTEQQLQRIPSASVLDSQGRTMANDIAEDSDEDIFADAGRFNPEEEMADLEPSSSLADVSVLQHQYFQTEFEESALSVRVTPSTEGSSQTAARTTDSLRVTDPARSAASVTDGPQTFGASLRHQRRLASRQQHDEYSECYPGVATEQAYCWDDDEEDNDDVQGNKKAKRKVTSAADNSKDSNKPKFTARAARRQAEREWKTLEGYIEAKKHRNLDVIELDLHSKNATTRPASRFPDVV